MGLRKPRLVLIPMLALHAGCASLTASAIEPFQVGSNPPGAEVRLNGVPVGRTPAVIAVQRVSPFVDVEVGAAGYLPQACPVRHYPGAGFVTADVLLCAFLFPVGCISFIDAGGAWNTLSAPGCYVSLQPASGAPPPGPGFAPPPPLPPTQPGAGYGLQPPPPR